MVYLHIVRYMLPATVYYDDFTIILKFYLCNGYFICVSVRWEKCSKETHTATFNFSFLKPNSLKLNFFSLKFICILITKWCLSTINQHVASFIAHRQVPPLCFLPVVSPIYTHRLHCAVCCSGLLNYRNSFKVFAQLRWQFQLDKYSPTKQTSFTVISHLCNSWFVLQGKYADFQTYVECKRETLIETCV